MYFECIYANRESFHRYSWLPKIKVLTIRTSRFSNDKPFYSNLTQWVDFLSIHINLIYRHLQILKWRKITNLKIKIVSLVKYCTFTFVTIVSALGCLQPGEPALRYSYIATSIIPLARRLERLDPASRASSTLRTSAYLWYAFLQAYRVTPNVSSLTGNAGEILICWHSASAGLSDPRPRRSGNSG